MIDGMSQRKSELPFWWRKDKDTNQPRLPVRIIGASIFGHKKQHVGFAVSEFGHEVRQVQF